MLALVLLAGLPALFPASGDPARFHPPEADLFLELPDVQGMRAAYPEAPLYRLLADEELVSFVEGLAGREFDGGSLVHEGLGQLEIPADVRALVSRGLGDLRSVSLSVTGIDTGFAEAAREIGRVAATAALVTQVAASIHAHAGERGVPASLAELEAYAEVPPLDAWGRPLVYAQGPEGEGFALSSLGADGAPGGTAEDADLLAGSADLEDGSRQASIVFRRFGLLVALEFSEPEVAESIEQASTRLEIPERFSVDLADGTRRVSLREAPDIGWWLRREGALLLLGCGTADPRRALERARAASAAPSLEGQARERFASLPEPGGTAITRTFGTTDLMDLSNRMRMLRLGDRGTLEMLDRAGIGFPVGADSPDTVTRCQFADRRFLFEAQSAPEVIERMLFATPVDRSFAALCPKDAIATSLFSWDPAILGEVCIAGGCASAALEREEWLAAIESRSGIRLDRDLFESLGRTVMVYLQPLMLPSLPRFAVCIEVDDSEALQRVLTALPKLLPDGWATAAKLATRPSGGIPITTASIGMFPVAAAVAHGKLFLAPGRTTILALLKQAKVPAAEPEHPLFQRELPEGLRQAHWIDWGAGLGSMVDSALKRIPLRAHPSGPPPIGSIVRRHFQPTVGWTAPRDGGQYSWYESSLGPETPVVVVAAAMLTVGVVIPLYAEENQAAQRAEAAPPDSGD